MNFRIWIWNRKYGYGNPYLDMEFHIRIWDPYPDLDFHIQICDPKSRPGSSYPDMDSHIQICDSISRSPAWTFGGSEAETPPGTVGKRIVFCHGLKLDFADLKPWIRGGGARYLI